MLLAQSAPAIAETVGPWVQFGAVGACLMWFMFRSEPRLRAIEASINRASRVLINLSIAIANALEAIQWHGAKAIRLQAEPIIAELDEIDRRNKTKTEDNGQ